MTDTPESVIEIYGFNTAGENILPTFFKPKTNGNLNLAFSISDAALDLRLILGGNGGLYSNTESLTITGVDSGATNAVAVAVAASVTGLSAITVTSGTGYIDGEEVTIEGGTSGANGARGFAVVTGPNLTDVTIVTSTAIPGVDLGSFAIGFHNITIPVTVGSQYNFELGTGTLRLFSINFTK